MLFFWSALRVNSTSLALSSASRMSLNSGEPMMCAPLGLRLVQCDGARVAVLRGGLSWQREIKSCALAHRAFGPGSPAVPGYDAPHDCQTDARAFKFVAVQPLKYAKQLVAIPHVEPHAVVAHEKHPFPALFPATDCNRRLRPGLG